METHCTGSMILPASQTHGHLHLTTAPHQCRMRTLFGLWHAPYRLRQSSLTGHDGARVMAGDIAVVEGGVAFSYRLPAMLAQALPTAGVQQVEEHAAAARGAMSAETVRAWAKAWSAVWNWVAGHRLAVLHATAGTVATCVDSLTESGRAPASIRQAIWAIGKRHRAAGLEDPARANRQTGTAAHGSCLRHAPAPSYSASRR